ncbi:DUF1559 domain-containing protein [Aeoliella sp. ICT_H6.2]|uniref:DUF1559 domain-containing protein n=1 Tax=Aeoliella straminimaris TaxID=2954799 RepID=A0A9X2JJ70_9BACT|nr:DUF1559 domain-containing protein [Aeoliella straminimaris]MCO6044684.1 DUF1559 domain-containing protein [Aeoliella straminimaris]
MSNHTLQAHPLSPISSQTSAKLLVTAALSFLLATPVLAQALPETPTWTLDSARRHAQLYPNDPYAQYVALQLSRREGAKAVQATAALLRRREGFTARRSGRRADVDLLSFTSGALAVQESLQLDTMTADMMAGSLGSPRMGRQDQGFNGSPENRRRLQQLSLALLNYESVHGHLPASYSTNAQGEPLLSWRVHILPFLEQSALYDQFRLNEPWDSPHNKQLMAQMPEVFRGSTGGGANATKTTFLVPTGKGTVFEGTQGVRLRQITDGTSNTLMILQLKPEKAVEWTRPQDIKIDVQRPFEDVFHEDQTWIDGAAVDGSIHSLPKSAGPAAFGSMLQRNDGQIVDWQAIRRNAPPRRMSREKPGIDIHSLKGPTIKSHPFAEMLGNTPSRTSELSNLVPNDFYFVHSRSMSKLLSIVNDYEAWSSELLRQALPHTQRSTLASRTLGQLGMDPASPAMQRLDQTLVEIAVVGSDLYLNDGSDVTLLLRFAPDVEMSGLLEGELAAARNQHEQAETSQGEYAGVAYTRVTTPDRSIHAFSATPRPDIVIRSNSLVAFRRVLDQFANSGGDQQATSGESLGKTSEFRYVRTVFEYGAEEDVFVYFSDPFIRQLMGPSSKITELRRRQCHVHLQMIQYASLLFQTEHGALPTSLEQLVESNCLPEAFLAGSLQCPDGGQYQWSQEQHRGCCSHHGCAGCMKPGCETTAEKVTYDERLLYEAFLAEYNEYWRTYFDPIAFRIRHTPEASRVETLILPLLDNSIYTAIADVLGDTPPSAILAPVSERVVLSIGATYSKQNVFAMESPSSESARSKNLKQIALAVLNFESVHRRLPPATADGSSLSWRVHILPYLGQRALYDRFHLDEPWDSEHNKPLLKEMPDIYGAEGTKTSILGFEGKGVLNNQGAGLQLAQMRDGLSNTLLAVDAGEAQAVPWTKPQDLSFDPADPLASLGAIGAEGLNVVFVDGHAAVLPTNITAEQLLGYVTYNGREIVQHEPTPRRRRGAIREKDIRNLLRGLGAPREDLEQLDIAGLVQRGLGNQLGFHVFDAEPAFSFNPLRFAGQLMSDQSGWLRPEFLFVMPLVNSLNAPVYVTCSIDDPSVVDGFLHQLDGVLATAARTDATTPVQFDFYRVASFDQPAWCIAWDFFGFRLRVFYTRLGDHLVIASQPVVLEDLLRHPSSSPDGPGARLPGHVKVQIRPQHWSRIMNEMQLTWGEAAREACLSNLGPLNSAARLAPHGSNDPTTVAQEAFGATYVCPCGGTYYLNQVEGQHNSVRCTLHGDAGHPQQTTGVPDNSPAAMAASSLGDVDASLTFTEHGLQAVIEIQRRIPSD